jgi:PEGA domain
MVGSLIVVRRLTRYAIACVLAIATHARADTPELNIKIAVWRFDALGIEPELVARLETLFRMELDRLDKQPLPNRRDIDRALPADLKECGGEDKCLAAIGKKLGVDIVVTGTVGAMGDTYVLNIKAVDTNTAKQIQRIQTDPLRGSPDELIDGVRVAAYKLLAPQQLFGGIQVQTDLVGAEVALDGKPLGKTPLPSLGMVARQPLGKHRLHVEAKGYAPFDEDVDVRFQKVSQVVVRLLPSTEVIGTGKVVHEERSPFYTKTWFIVSVGVAAVFIGAAIGHEAGHVKTCTIDMGKTTCN